MVKAVKSITILLGIAILVCFCPVLLSGQESTDPRFFTDSGAIPPPLAGEALVFNQGTIPEALKQPQRGGESPRFPRDAVIGELGRGTASEEAYRYACNLMIGVLSGNRESALLTGAAPALLGELFAGLEPLKPQRYRLGGGREEPDGSTSFLFRFISREQSLAGELYLRRTEDKWKLEDLIVEEARDITERGSTYKFDFSPYERFF